MKVETNVRAGEEYEPTDPNQPNEARIRIPVG